MADAESRQASLFDFCKTGGCAAKLDPGSLSGLLSSLPLPQCPSLLVGFAQRDDAAVYRLKNDMALVATVDVIAPPVDNPHVYGQIAAANALSDVYAMGGVPKLCLSILALPETLGLQTAHRILAGAFEKTLEAEAIVAGGHVVRNDQLLFGLAVVGFVHPTRVWRNGGAMAGDALILTKPIGTGIIFTAGRQQKISQSDLSSAVTCTTALNAAAREVLTGYDVHGVTDVTGFGLAGHMLEMAKASQCTLRIEIAKVPVLAGARLLCDRGVTTSITWRNRAYVEPHMDVAVPAESLPIELLFDPQTNGGLLAAVPARQAAALLEALHSTGLDQAVCIGTVETLGDKHIVVGSSS